MADITNVSGKDLEVVILKFPLSSDVVPCVVPLSMIEACMTASPLLALFTAPLMVAF